MENEIIEKVKEFVEEECKKNDRGYYKEWLDHLRSVEKYAKDLAKKLNADKEIVVLASWLHDIACIIHGKKDHHIIGAEIAEKKLFEFNYPQEKINQVKHCILTHRGSVPMKRETIEAQIIADADSMSHFDNTDGLFQAYFVFNKLEREKAKKPLKEKLARSWNKLSDTTKKEFQGKYNEILEKLK